MKLNAILIQTNDEGKIAIVLKDYSKENVINAISANLAIRADNIVQLSASMSRGLYAIKNECFTSDLKALDYDGKLCADYDFVFEVDYIKVIK